MNFILKKPIRYYIDWQASEGKMRGRSVVHLELLVSGTNEN